MEGLLRKKEIIKEIQAYKATGGQYVTYGASDLGMPIEIDGNVIE
jgi:hypothetical protein